MRVVIVMVLLFGFAVKLNANEQHELKNIAQIHDELGMLVALVEKYEKQRVFEANAPYEFSYGKLLERLRDVKSDIALHIDWVQSRPKWKRFNVE